jgi:hypothetical protein
MGANVKPIAISTLLRTRRVSELVIFLLSFAVFIALAPWMIQTWKPLGDEPHYLIAAHSLVYDHDLDLANNYAEGDYRRFLDVPFLDPHVKLTASGAQILNHDLGLVVAIAPAYALGGRAAVVVFLAFMAALLAVQTFLLARDVTHSARIAVLTWLALTFTPPLLLYAFLVYPELPGALVLIWAVRAILFKPRGDLSNARIWTLALAFAALPWLSSRFFVVLAVLALLGFAHWRGVFRRVLPVYMISALSVAAYFFVNYILLVGTPPPGTGAQVGASGLAVVSASSVTRGLIGWWLDPQRGTLVLAPVYVLALAGIPRMIRQMSGASLALLLPLALTNLLLAVLGAFWIAFEVGARYLVVALPLLAAPLALALQSGLGRASRSPLRSYAFAGFGLCLLLLSVLNGALMIGDASYAYGSVVSAYSRVVGRDLSPWFAGMGHAALVRAQAGEAGSDSAPGIAVIQLGEDPLWYAPRGVEGLILQSSELTELTDGNYDLKFGAAAANVADPASELLTLDIFSSEGLQIAHASWRGADWTERGVLQPFVVNFDNPYFDHWTFPLSLQVATTGQSDLRLGAFTFDPDTAKTWARAAVWVGLVLLLVVLLNLG